MLTSITNSKSKRFLTYCFTFLIGVAIISIIDTQLDLLYLYIALFAAGFLLIVTWSKKPQRFFAFCFLFFIFGIARYQLAFPLTSNHVSKYNGEKIELAGYIAAEPDVRQDGVRYIVKTHNTDNITHPISGRVYVKSGLYPRYSYGDELHLKCHLKTPEPIEDFRYDRYLSRFGVFSICQGASIKRIGTGDGNTVFRSVLSLKEVVAERINTLWHEPYASFMAGLLYGYRGGLGQLNELFSRTGVTHIVAISGYNITIIATLLITFCINLYIPRKRAFWFVTAGIVVFLIFAGLSASVVRAGIMGILVLVAKQMGRLSRVGNVLMLTAVIMTIHNPFILIWDAGFQLSFLSTLGLVYLSPHLGRLFSRIPEAFGLRESLIATLAATIMTLPLILFQFGRLSIVAVPVNMLILWIIPFIMMLGFFAVVASVLFEPLAMIISWIAWAGMKYITEIVAWFAALPFAAIDVRVSFFVMVAMYGMLALVYRKKSYKQSS